MSASKEVNLENYIGRLSTDMDSETYHSTKNTFSSSQLKTMLEDPEVFYRKYITKEIEKESIPAFDVGTYFHTALLEPIKLLTECAVYTGGMRRGKEWDKFKEDNAGKAIITSNEKEIADTLIRAVTESPISMGFLESSTPEVSAFVELYVLSKEIFTFIKGKCHWLSINGWAEGSLDYEDEDTVKEFGTKIILKVRADSLGNGTGIISDLKSTTGNCKNPYQMQERVSSYQYDLSAALYLDIFSAVSETPYHTFVWIFASKDLGNAKSYKATDKNIMVGRAKWKKAVIELAFYLNNNWSFTDSLGEIGPSNYNLQWLEDF